MISNQNWVQASVYWRLCPSHLGIQIFLGVTLASRSWMDDSFDIGIPLTIPQKTRKYGSCPSSSTISERNFNREAALPYWRLLVQGNPGSWRSSRLAAIETASIGEEYQLSRENRSPNVSWRLVGATNSLSRCIPLLRRTVSEPWACVGLLAPQEWARSVGILLALG